MKTNWDDIGKFLLACGIILVAGGIFYTGLYANKKVSEFAKEQEAIAEAKRLANPEVANGEYGTLYRVHDKKAGMLCYITANRRNFESAISCVPTRNLSIGAEY